MAIKRYTANADNTITNAYKANLKERAKAPIKEGLVTQQWVDELTATKA